MPFALALPPRYIAATDLYIPSSPYRQRIALVLLTHTAACRRRCRAHGWGAYSRSNVLETSSLLANSCTCIATSKKQPKKLLCPKINYLFKRLRLTKVRPPIPNPYRLQPSEERSDDETRCRRRSPSPPAKTQLHALPKPVSSFHGIRKMAGFIFPLPGTYPSPPPPPPPAAPACFTSLPVPRHLLITQYVSASP